MGPMRWTRRGKTIIEPPKPAMLDIGVATSETPRRAKKEMRSITRTGGRVWRRYDAVEEMAIATRCNPPMLPHELYA